jgi:hypothetical protein
MSPAWAAGPAARKRAGSRRAEREDFAARRAAAACVVLQFASSYVSSKPPDQDGRAMLYHYRGLRSLAGGPRIAYKQEGV